VVVLALITAITWFAITGDSGIAITTGIAVLVIACPCALGLATPTALLVGTSRGAQLGILIRGPHAIESSQKIDVIVMDKTGTLTAGRMSVVEVFTKIEPAKLWQIVDALELSSTHPIATSLRTHAREFEFSKEFATSVSTIGGSGVQGIVAGHSWALGSPKWRDVPNGEFAEVVNRFESRGDSVVVVHQADQPVAVIALADALDPSSLPALAHLKELKITPIVASGDNEVAVQKVSNQLSIARFFANSSPAAKLELVTETQNQGHFVAMIGDGINDAAALAKAHLSLAMGAGADVAASAADIVLLRSTMAAAVDAIELSRATMRTIKVNLFWALAYNVAAIPLAMFGLLGPVIAAAAMAFSSVFVVTNSLRLRSFKSISS